MKIEWRKDEGRGDSELKGKSDQERECAAGVGKKQRFINS